MSPFEDFNKPSIPLPIPALLIRISTSNFDNFEYNRSIFVTSIYRGKAPVSLQIVLSFLLSLSKA